ncbi:hypothetical protein PV773_22510 [Mesorhizobium sp. CC13]|uniref:hypothetical protein n=1 Tax=Mesorhizobium sp. CC13 TaxID=3029194 RepID=UPI003264EE1C
MGLGFFQRCGKWIDHHQEPISLVISAVSLVFFTNFWTWIIEKDSPLGWRAAGVLGIIVAIGSAWFAAKSQNALAVRNSELEDQLANMQSVVSGFGSDYFDIWDRRLQVLAEELGFDARDRISVYRHHDNAFTMVGRYAVLPQLDKPGRSVYPVDQGVIGAAWRAGNGQCVVQDLPDPHADPDDYCARNKDEWQIPAEVVQAMNMKPRSVAAFALNDQQGSSRHAIIVFESTDADRFSVAALEKRVRGTPGKDIVYLLEIMRNREPSLEFAREKGF